MPLENTFMSERAAPGLDGGHDGDGKSLGDRPGLFRII